MAYTKKTDTSSVNEEVKTEIKETKQPKKVKKTYTDSDYILCRSIWAGGLNIICKSGNSYEFKDYGEECDINYRDLVALIRKGSDHVFLPRFIILDEELLEDFPNVKRAYEAMYTKSDLLEILDLPNTRMLSEIDKLPESTKVALQKIISTEIANGHLDSISKVRALSEYFKSDFNLLSELFVR